MPNDQPLGAGLADQKLVPTSIGAWQKQEEPKAAPEDGFIAELPSGNIVLMTRTLDLQLLLKTGKIPNPLAGIVQTMIDKKSTAFPVDQTDQKVLMQLLDLLNETAVRAIITPPFDAPAKRAKGQKAEDYQEYLEEWLPALTEDGAVQHAAALAEDADHAASCKCERKVSVWDMTMDDRFFVFAVAQGAAADLAAFRAEQERLVGDLQAGQGVRKPTKRTGGTRSKKKK